MTTRSRIRIFFYYYNFFYYKFFLLNIDKILLKILFSRVRNHILILNDFIVRSFYANERKNYQRIFL